MAVDHLGVLHQINVMDVNILVNDVSKRRSVPARSMIAALRLIESLMTERYEPAIAERLLYDVIKEVRAMPDLPLCDGCYEKDMYGVE